MQTEELPYETHGIGYGGGVYPAANVKVRNLHVPNEDALSDHGITDADDFLSWFEDHDEQGDVDDMAFGRASESWWTYRMPDIVSEWNDTHPDETFSLDRIHAEGRSSGWVVIWEDHVGHLGESWGWEASRREAWAELADELTASARTDGHYDYWEQVGRWAVEFEEYGQERRTYLVTVTHEVAAASEEHALRETEGSSGPSVVSVQVETAES